MPVTHLGLIDYATCFAAMQSFTSARTEDTPDELWLCEHPSVFTQGLAGKTEHVLVAGNIPVVQSNRGGQVTYHGPGQIVAYPLINLKARGYFVKEYVYRLEEALIRTLAAFNITGHRVRTAPGIYVRLADPSSHAMLSDAEKRVDAAGEPLFTGLGKVAALGIKVSRHFTLHGLALNVTMDLEPFGRINPCGYAGLQTVDMRQLGVDVALSEVQTVLAQQLVARL